MKQEENQRKRQKMSYKQRVGGSNPSTPTKRQKGRKTIKVKRRHKVC